MQFVTEDQPDLSLSEDKIYRAVLMEIQPKEIRWTPDKGKNAGIEQTKILLEWWWEVQDESLRNPATGELRRVKGSCEARITNGADNRFRCWAEALLQREIGVGTPIDTDDLIALPADISIRKVPDRKDPAKVYDEIAEVLPVYDSAYQSEPPF